MLTAKKTNKLGTVSITNIHLKKRKMKYMGAIISANIYFTNDKNILGEFKMKINITNIYISVLG